MERQGDVAVLGAGIAGLTAAALLARAGLEVDLLEAHSQSGGCAGTFRRGPYVFDAGATQVAGLEPGGIHARLFAHLQVPPPRATPLDPACVVDLQDGQAPVRLWRDPLRWQEERRRQFPGSEAFWALCAWLHAANWGFAQRDPVLPPRSLWDLGQLCAALRPANLAAGLLTTATVADLLALCGCGGNRRLRRYLDLQLKLYSQEPADRTAALYGATALAVAQEPQGLWHLDGSMQELSRALEQGLHQSGGHLRLRHRVRRLRPRGEGWSVEGEGPGGQPFHWEGRAVVCTLPPQALPTLLGEALPAGYAHRLEGLAEPSGALVFYGAVPRKRLPDSTPSHLQRDGTAAGPLFVSVSEEGDGRAPRGAATVIASVFTAARPWFGLPEEHYRRRRLRPRPPSRPGSRNCWGWRTATGSTGSWPRRGASPAGPGGPGATWGASDSTPVASGPSAWPAARRCRGSGSGATRSTRARAPPGEPLLADALPPVAGGAGLGAARLNGPPARRGDQRNWGRRSRQAARASWRGPQASERTSCSSAPRQWR